MLREKSGLTQAEVARLAACSHAYLSLVEAGKKKPSRRWVGHVAAVIGEHMKAGAA